MSSDAKSVNLYAKLLRQEPEYCLYCLDYRFVDVLLSLTERMKWSSTWIEENGEYAVLTDVENQVIERGIWSLLQCQDLTDLQEQISQVLTLLQENGNMSGNNCCCGCGCNGGQNPIANDESIPPGGDTPPTGTTTTTDEVWICNASVDVCERYKQFWQVVSNYATSLSASVLGGILDGLFIFYGYGGAFAVLLSTIGQYLTQGLAQSCIAMLNEVCPAVVSAIRTAANAQEAKSSVQSIMLAASNHPWYARQANWALATLGNWEMVFTPGSWDVPQLTECSEIIPPDECFLEGLGYALESPSAMESYTTAQSDDSLTISQDIALDVDDPCGTVGLFNSAAAITAPNQTWRPFVRFKRAGAGAIGYVILVDRNEAIGGNGPSQPLNRVGFDNNGLAVDENTEASFISYAPFSFACVQAAYVDELEPIFGEVARIEIADLDDKWILFDLYKGSSGGNNKFGGLVVNLRIAFIVPAL